MTATEITSFSSTAPSPALGNQLSPVGGASSHVETQCSNETQTILCIIQATCKDREGDLRVRCPCGHPEQPASGMFTDCLRRHGYVSGGDHVDTCAVCDMEGEDKCARSIPGQFRPSFILGNCG